MTSPRRTRSAGFGTSQSVPRRRSDQRGVSSVEIIISMMLFSAVTLGAAASATTARLIQRRANMQVEYWAAMQSQIEGLYAIGYDSIVSGSNATYMDMAVKYPTSWTVTGTDPKQIVMVSSRTTDLHKTVTDTLVLYVANPTP